LISSAGGIRMPPDHAQGSRPGGSLHRPDTRDFS
jgi:hypothetical protein